MSDSYTPPPPPRRGLSPWAWVGIGCAGITVLGFGGCIAFVSVVTNRVQQEMKAPFNKEEALSQLGDVPLYPNAPVDEEISKAGRAGLSLFKGILPAESAVVVGLRTDAPTEGIFEFYDEKLAALGYKPANLRQSGMNQQRQYQKGKDMVMVQVQMGKNGGKAIMLMRFHNLRQK